ncbi:ABC transporter permease [Candidatus Woesearchaeota archaeon]|nr:ABC transporter permease [Candidatus Woesearchaeota archaeon]
MPTKLNQKIKEYFILATTNLFHRKLRSWLTMIGIFIGIAAVVSLISLGQGMKDAIFSQFSALGTDNIIIQAKQAMFGPPGSSTAAPLTKDDRDIIKKSHGVELVATRLIKAIQIDFEKKTFFRYAATFSDDNEARNFMIERFKFKIEKGRFMEIGEKNKIIIGQNYAKEPVLGRELRVGDKLSINKKEVEIVGILAKTGNPQFDNTFFLNEEALREILNLDDRIDIIIAKASNKDDIEQVVETIKKNLRNHRNVEKDKEDFEVQTSQQLISSLRTILTIVTAVLVGIAMISIIVGGVGITNTMYTAVLERTKEIGIMKAIGAKNSDILLIFLMESGLLGMVGGIIGVIFGIALSKTVEIIAANALGSELIKASFPPALIIGALLFSFLIGAISGTSPAIQAARLKPVDALNQE